MHHCWLGIIPITSIFHDLSCADCPSAPLVRRHLSITPSPLTFVFCSVPLLSRLYLYGQDAGLVTDFSCSHRLHEAHPHRISPGPHPKATARRWPRHYQHWRDLQPERTS